MVEVVSDRRSLEEVGNSSHAKSSRYSQDFCQLLARSLVATTALQVPDVFGTQRFGRKVSSLLPFTAVAAILLLLPSHSREHASIRQRHWLRNSARGMG